MNPNETVLPDKCSVCRGAFGPVPVLYRGVVGKGQGIMIEGQLDFVCAGCDMWVYRLLYGGQIGSLKDFIFKDLH